MRWSNLHYSDFYIPFDENQRAIRGFWLTTLGIDLENLPTAFEIPFKYFETQPSKNHRTQKVFLTSIVGTSYHDYANAKIVLSYMKIKRADNYIANGMVTPGKYFRNLKKPVCRQELPIILSQNQDGTYFVDGNGNHRIILYKMMMLAEIGKTYPDAYIYEPDFIRRKVVKEITDKYWLYANINT